MELRARGTGARDSTHSPPASQRASASSMHRAAATVSPAHRSATARFARLVACRRSPEDRCSRARSRAPRHSSAASVTFARPLALRGRFLHLLPDDLRVRPPGPFEGGRVVNRGCNCLGSLLRRIAHGMGSGWEDRDASQNPGDGLVNPRLGSTRSEPVRGTTGRGRALRHGPKCAKDGTEPGGITGAMGDQTANEARVGRAGVAAPPSFREGGLPARVERNARRDSRGQDARAPGRTAGPRSVSRPFTRTPPIPKGREPPRRP